MSDVPLKPLMNPDNHEESWAAMERIYGPVRPWAGDDTTRVWKDCPSSFLDLFLELFQWWRRRRGGHWEMWLMDHPVAAEVWYHPVQCCRRRLDGRALRHPVGGFMVRRCEDYP